MSNQEIVNFRVIPFISGQEQQVYSFIRKVYDEFVAGEYSEKGNSFFYEWIEPTKISFRQQEQNNIWLAFHEEELVGMIEIRDESNISLLFVDKKFHGHGVAKKLFEISLKEILKRKQGIEKFFVHASPFSIPVYRKMGFVETDQMKEEHGIRYLPMEFVIV